MLSRNSLLSPHTHTVFNTITLATLVKSKYIKFLAAEIVATSAAA